MCGIAAAISENPETVTASITKSLRVIEPRGPDSTGRCNELGGALQLAACVLHLRGSTGPTKQPLVDNRGNALLWNGEVFGGLHVGPNKNDTICVLEQLSASNTPEEIVAIMGSIYGPWSFVYWKPEKHIVGTLYFGRDPRGRRSLMASPGIFQEQSTKSLNSTDNDVLSTDNDVDSTVFRADIVNSPTTTRKWLEIPPLGIFSVHLSLNDQGCLIVPLEVKLHKWTQNLTFSQLPIRNRLLPRTTAADLLLEALKSSVAKRISNLASHKFPIDCRSSSESDSHFSPARIGILFSGGLDSMIIAALCIDLMPSNEPLDLINVCFDSESMFLSPDRKNKNQNNTTRTTTTLRLLLCNETFENVRKESKTIEQLIHPKTSNMDFNIGAALWFASKGLATGGIITNISELNRHFRQNRINRRNKMRQCNQISNATGLSDDHSNDKENSHTKNTMTSKQYSAQCHGRFIKGKNCKKNPHADCEFLCCISCCHRTHTLLRQTTNPNNKNMKIDTSKKQKLETKNVENMKIDTSKKQNIETKNDVSYQSCARVLLTGTGADEYAGGYGRHKFAYTQNGRMGLARELNLDQCRINFGRDDRILSVHGREARFPFLDENVTCLLRSLPLDIIVDFSLPRGMGDKLIIRDVARILGLDTAASLPKRAIQFGTRIAKQSNVWCYGSSTAANKHAAGSAKVKFL
eukprot:GSMAST32.ASY1.ANO1.2759.1 assembled CDS